MENTSGDLSHFHVFGYKAYVFLPNKVCTNKLVPCSELMIFIGYKNNSYCFICHIQGNVIFHSLFDKKFFSKCTDFHVKEHKLYNKLLDKISPETELSVLGPSSKDRPTLVFIPLSSIPLFKMIFLLILPLFFSLISLHFPYFL